MNRIKLIAIFILILQVYSSLAQNTEYKTINGTILNDKFKAISLVNIFSVKTGNGTLSANDGSFSIRIKQTDTLKLSAIGYKTKYIAANSLVKEKNYIVLDQQIYLLSDVPVLGYGNWLEFKQEFMNKKLKPMEQKILVIKGLPNPYQILVPNNALSTNPITMIYQLFNKKAIMERKQKRWNKTYKESWMEFRKK